MKQERIRTDVDIKTGNPFVRLERWKNRPGVYALRDLPTGTTMAIFDRNSMLTIIEDFARLVAEDFPDEKIFELEKGE